ncbi:MAG TPA: sulfurtransferase TusA family protein [Gallionella sp.]|nr:sulfurtransferase TusA family protein [Gallionella sp.]
MNIDLELDTRGNNCPMPILRTKKAIAGLSVGNVLKILASDPGSVKDMEAFCRQTGNELVQTQQESGIYTFMVRKM